LFNFKLVKINEKLISKSWLVFSKYGNIFVTELFSISLFPPFYAGVFRGRIQALCSTKYATASCNLIAEFKQKNSK